jgi:hypothetical protein
MFKDFLQIRNLSIVILGDFNPAIFQPAWFSEKKLIREQEALDSKIEIIHPDLTRIDFKWANLEIQRTRFELRTSLEPYYEPLKDLCISTFELLKETPLKVLGINHVFYFALKDKKAYYDFGNILVPLSNWDTFLNNPRVLELVVFEEDRQDKQKGFFRIQISPSEIKLNTPYALTININDHYSLNEGDFGRHGEILTLLKKNWKTSFERSDKIIEEIWRKVNG